MLNFEEELKRFKPALEVEGIESAVYRADLSDVRDSLPQSLEEDTESLSTNLNRNLNKNGSRNHAYDK